MARWNGLGAIPIDCSTSPLEGHFGIATDVGQRQSLYAGSALTVIGVLLAILMPIPSFQVIPPLMALATIGVVLLTPLDWYRFTGTIVYLPGLPDRGAFLECSRRVPASPTASGPPLISPVRFWNS